MLDNGLGETEVRVAEGFFWEGAWCIGAGCSGNLVITVVNGSFSSKPGATESKSAKGSTPEAKGLGWGESSLLGNGLVSR